MKKVIVIVPILFMTLLIINIWKFDKKNGIKYEDSAYLAVNVNGQPSNSFPDYTTGDYTVSVNCTNANGRWMPVENGTNIDWHLELDNISGTVSCSLNFETIIDDDLLINVVEENANYKNETYGYRYIYDVDNNYIWFNNDLYRIIGSIPVKQSNSLTSNLVKIIRNESIGGLTYDNTNSNIVQYGSSTIYTVLNSYFYGANNGNNSSICYSVAGSSVKSKCDYRVIGIKNNGYYAGMIKNVYWNTGVSSSTTETDVYNDEVSIQNTQARIGLLSYSDKLFVGSSSGWLNYRSYTWTITPYNNTSIWMAYAINQYITSNSYSSVKPVLYLDDSIYIVSGNGTIDNPYVISLPIN